MASSPNTLAGPMVHNFCPSFVTSTLPSEIQKYPVITKGHGHHNTTASALRPIYANKWMLLFAFYFRHQSANLLSFLTKNQIKLRKQSAKASKVRQALLSGRYGISVALRTLSFLYQQTKAEIVYLEKHHTYAVSSWRCPALKQKGTPK